MTNGEFIEVVGGPLDGSRMEFVEETRMGFTHVSGNKAYRYALKQITPQKGEFIVRRRYVLEKVISGKRKTKGEEGGT
jgi:hypothetical protein